MISESVYCIVVTYNGLRWIDACLIALRESSYPLSCIVVDNASADGTATHIAAHYPEVIVIQESTNLGFGQANNRGIKVALEQNAGYIFLLNQDVYIQPTTISVLLGVMQTHPEIGILSPVHLNGNGNSLDEHFYFYLARTDIRKLLFDLLSGTNPLVPILFTRFVNAAAWMLPADCIRVTGGFDPIFFHYGEDDNYALRVRHKGFQIAISTGASIKHDHDRSKEHLYSTPERKAEKEFLNELNHLCDPHLENFRYIYLKHLFRHTTAMVFYGLGGKKEAFRYHRSISAWLFQSHKKIIQSRSAVLSTRSGVFLY